MTNIIKMWEECDRLDSQYREKGWRIELWCAVRQPAVRLMAK